jgi:hypothetical protein
MNSSTIRRQDVRPKEPMTFLWIATIPSKLRTLAAR